MKPRDQLGGDRNTLDIIQPLNIEDLSTFCHAPDDISIEISFNSAKPEVEAFLNICLHAVQESINDGATGFITRGRWRGPLGPNQLGMVVWSEDDYQTTYMNVLSAIQALIAWMSSSGHIFGTCAFTIWSREHRIGHGDVSDGL